MIVCTTQPLYRYSGLSTDTKPTKNIKDASTFWETDKGKYYEWRFDDWIPIPTPTVVVDIPALESVQVSNFPGTQPVSAENLPLPGGAASSANQIILESLIDTLQELIQRLTPLGSAMNIAGGVGLRVVGVGGTMTASGPLTSAQYTASNLTSRLAVENQTAVLANINNCVGA